MRVALTLAFACLPAIVLAHGDAERDPRILSGWDVAAISILLGMGVLYLAGMARLARRGVAGRTLEHAAFWAGWIVMLAAIAPPLDALALRWFSAHMLQHELLMLVGVPLLIAGGPMATCLWGLPARWRAAAGRLFQDRASTGRAWRLMTAPVVAWALHGLTIWVWHVPALYDLAVRDESIHAVQHAMFTGTSALFWWGLVYGRYGRAGYGASVFYVFTTAVHTGILGAMLTFAGTPIYPEYIGRTADPLGDQQVAGLVMWVPAGLVLTLAGVGLFASWLGASERRTAS